MLIKGSVIEVSLLQFRMAPPSMTVRESGSISSFKVEESLIAYSAMRVTGKPLYVEGIVSFSGSVPLVPVIT